MSAQKVQQDIALLWNSKVPVKITLYKEHHYFCFLYRIQAPLLIYADLKEYFAEILYFYESAVRLFWRDNEVPWNMPFGETYDTFFNALLDTQLPLSLELRLGSTQPELEKLLVPGKSLAHHTYNLLKKQNSEFVKVFTAPNALREWAKAIAAANPYSFFYNEELYSQIKKIYQNIGVKITLLDENNKPLLTHTVQKVYDCLNKTLETLVLSLIPQNETYIVTTYNLLSLKYFGIELPRNIELSVLYEYLHYPFGYAHVFARIKIN